MAASYPAAIKSFSAIVNGVTKLVAALFNSPYDEITAIQTELGTDPAGSAADVKTRLAIALNADGTLKTNAVVTATITDANVTQGKLKTDTSEVSDASSSIGLLNPSGGEYGFTYMHKKASAANAYIHPGCGSSGNDQAGSLTTSYAQYITFNSRGGTVYAQTRYVTSSGLDYWIFLLLDSITKEILSAAAAPDHPSYGNGGDVNKLPHPFTTYDKTKHEIVLLDKVTCDVLVQESKNVGESILTLINEEYKPNMTKTEPYIPLHTGKFVDKAPVLVDSIPDYIKVRKLIKLTNAEKIQKEVKSQQLNEQLAQIKKLNKQKKESAINKLMVLGLTEDEINVLVDV